MAIANKSKMEYSAQKRILILVETKERLQEKMRPWLCLTGIEEVANKYRALYRFIDELIAMDAKIIAEIQE